VDTNSRTNQRLATELLLERVDQLASSLSPQAIIILIVEALQELSAKVTPSVDIQRAMQDSVLEELRVLRIRIAPTVNFKFVNATEEGDTELVERIPDKKIQAVGFNLNNRGGAAIGVHFRSGSRPISSTKMLAANGGGMVVARAQGFHFETAIGEALNLNLNAAGTVGADVTYIEADE
jgi:hypothetical protein